MNIYIYVVHMLGTFMGSPDLRMGVMDPNFNTEGYILSYNDI